MSGVLYEDEGPPWNQGEPPQDLNWSRLVPWFLPIHLLDWWNYILDDPIWVPMEVVWLSKIVRTATVPDRKDRPYRRVQVYWAITALFSLGVATHALIFSATQLERGLAFLLFWPPKTDCARRCLTNHNGRGNALNWMAHVALIHSILSLTVPSSAGVTAVIAVALLRPGLAVCAQISVGLAVFYRARREMGAPLDGTPLVPLNVKDMSREVLESILLHNEARVGLPRSPGTKNLPSYAFSYVQTRDEQNNWMMPHGLIDALQSKENVWIDRMGKYQGVADHAWAYLGLEPYRRNRVYIWAPAMSFANTCARLVDFAGAPRDLHIGLEEEESFDVYGHSRAWPVCERAAGTSFEGLYTDKETGSRISRTFQVLWERAQSHPKFLDWLGDQMLTYAACCLQDSATCETIGLLDVGSPHGLVEFIPPSILGGGRGFGSAFTSSHCFKMVDKMAILARMVTGERDVATTKEVLESVLCRKPLQRPMLRPARDRLIEQCIRHAGSSMGVSDGLYVPLPVSPIATIDVVEDWLGNKVIQNDNWVNEGWRIVYSMPQGGVLCSRQWGNGLIELVLTKMDSEGRQTDVAQRRMVAESVVRNKLKDFFGEDRSNHAKRRILGVLAGLTGGQTETAARSYAVHAAVNYETARAAVNYEAESPPTFALRTSTGILP